MLFNENETGDFEKGTFLILQYMLIYRFKIRVDVKEVMVKIWLSSVIEVISISVVVCELYFVALFMSLA